MREIIKPALALAVICIVVALSISFTYVNTKDIILEKAEEKAKSNRKMVFSTADDFKKIDFNQEKYKNIKDFHSAYKNNKLEGYIVVSHSLGYSGAVNFITATDVNGKILKVKMGSNSETPGLGTKIGEPDFLNQFVNILTEKNLNIVKGKKTNPEDIDAISGATITSEAAVSAVQHSINIIKSVSNKEVSLN